MFKILLSLFISLSAQSQTDPSTGSTATNLPTDIHALCTTELKDIPHSSRIKNLSSLCNTAVLLDKCTSVKGHPIFHFNRDGDPKAKNSKRILVFSLIHGDEQESGAVSLSWADRLTVIEPRNTWRVVPILNPDGWKTRSRTNANGVDINRNFPSKDWDDQALKYWKTITKENDRRYPGPKAGSEPETQCALSHISDFKPDLVISIHTPLGVLDYDGPKVQFPKFTSLPWVSLGNFPGSLGRFLWLDRDVPVLTVELRQKQAASELEHFDRLQDITGTLAIEADKALKKKKSNSRAPTDTTPEEKPKDP